MLGKVKWFDPAKGFGFIVCDGIDYFAHHKFIQGQGYKILSEGQEVEFDAEENEKGPLAVNIRKVMG